MLIERSLPRDPAPSASARAAIDLSKGAPTPENAAPPASSESACESSAHLEGGTPAEGPKNGDTDGSEAQSDEPAPEPKRTKRAQTVEQAYSSGCSTSSVDGLSRQIVGEARCVDADAFAAVPPRKNLVTPGHVFLHLEAPARDRLLRVLDAHPTRTMTVNSALRTVAQQYLLDRWSRARRCGIQLAANPGESNHETGLALDVSEHGAWRSALEAQGFHWLGPSDRVHFDFGGPGAAHHDGLDVLAFQRLWNRNHPDDKIAENSRYDAPTEAHLKKAPAQGFAVGPQCARARQAGRALPHATRKSH